MATLHFELLNHDADKSFHCGNNTIENTIKESYFLTILQHAYAYEITYKNKILGYYMLLFRKIVLNTCPSEISDYYSEKMDYCVSIHIDFLAIDSCFQHKGIGTSVLKTIIAMCKRLIPFIPVRLITLDALKEYYEWYHENGFVAFDEKDLTNDCPTISMYIDCITNENVEKITKYQLV